MTTRRAMTRVGVAIAASAVGISIGGLYFTLRAHGTLDGPDATGSAVLATSFAVVGGIIVARRGHIVGWIMLLSGLFNSLNTIAADLSVVALEEGWNVRPAAAWLAPWIWSLGSAGFPLVLLFFPTGRPPSRRWWLVAGMTITGALLVACTGAIDSWSPAQLPLTGEQVIDRSGQGLWGTFGGIGMALLGLSLPLSAISLGFRYRRAGTIERLELKWLLFGGSFTIAVMFTASPGAPWDLESAIPLLSSLSLVGLAAIPIAVGIAITRYQLYDIDVLINRALVYGGLTVTVAAFYLALVFVLQSILPIETDSDIAVAASTLAAAALFRPLRARLQRVIDRRFYRRKYDAAITLAISRGGCGTRSTSLR